MEEKMKKYLIFAKIASVSPKTSITTLGRENLYGKVRRVVTLFFVAQNVERNLR